MDIVDGMETPDFSLMLGGPLFQVYRRARLSGDALELLQRRVIVITLFAWLPLLLLSLMEGHVFDPTLKVSFLRDIEAQVRFLVVLPLLIIAELVVHERLRPSMRRFVERKIILAEQLPEFYAAIQSTLRARNSVVLEVFLLIWAWTVGVWIWWHHVALAAVTWYATPVTIAGINRMQLTAAGHWYAFVSIPLIQFLLLRWYMRVVLWFHLLWKISKLKLQLAAAHPDNAGGLGFLGKASYGFAPLLFAEGALLAGLVANRVFYNGAQLQSLGLQMAGVVIFYVFCVLGPLAMFSPLLASTEREGLARYGLLASRYVSGFESKWLQKTAPDINDLLGTGDIQSLADLANSYSILRSFRLVPFSLTDFSRLTATAAAPLIPLLFTVFSIQQILEEIVKIAL